MERKQTELTKKTRSQANSTVARWPIVYITTLNSRAEQYCRGPHFEDRHSKTATKTATGLLGLAVFDGENWRNSKITVQLRRFQPPKKPAP